MLTETAPCELKPCQTFYNLAPGQFSWFEAPQKCHSAGYTRLCDPEELLGGGQTAVGWTSHRNRPCKVDSNGLLSCAFLDLSAVEPSVGGLQLAAHCCAPVDCLHSVTAVETLRCVAQPYVLPHWHNMAKEAVFLTLPTTAPPDTNGKWALGPSGIDPTAGSCDGGSTSSLFLEDSCFWKCDQLPCQIRYTAVRAVLVGGFEVQIKAAATGAQTRCPAVIQSVSLRIWSQILQCFLMLATTRVHSQSATKQPAYR